MNIGWLIVIIVIYLAVIAYLGYIGFKKTKTATDYLVGGRRVNPFVMALSYGATFISIIFNIIILLLTKVENPAAVTKAFGGIGKK
ncbi:MAG: hypothetical protein A2014_09050 [Spirochaetes bacterium GWF1_49_6]|nr:MAG: hypothetical protein A2014_09050 [Spirochaetes bacterium GWF1_49_6]